MTDWDTIVQEFGPAVWQTAYRLLGNRSDADECLQEVFATAVRVSRRQAVGNWAALLQKVAYSRSIDRLRRRRRDVLHDRADLTSHPALSREASPLIAAENGELTACLRVALAQLPARQAQAICLRYLSELSYEEIAQELDLDVRHVGVILSRAREKLRQFLGDGGTDHA